MYHRYSSRAAAGRALGDILAKSSFVSEPIVVALPRGGFPVGFEVAKRLNAPLDFIVVRKIGAPGHSELACGAFVLGGEAVWNTRILKSLHLTTDDLATTYQEEIKEAAEREEALRVPGAAPLQIGGASVIIVDDGLATGATMKAALQGVMLQKPKELIVAIPVGPVSTCRELEQMGCALVCDQRIDEENFSSVGQWYDEFPQVTTDECRELLVANRKAR